MTMYLHVQDFIPSAETLHADWRPSNNSFSILPHPQMLEITTASERARIICVQQHQCIAQSLSPQSVVFAPAVCQLLQSNAEDPVHIRPIKPYRVPIFVLSDLLDQQSTTKCIISPSLASLLSIDVQNFPELLLCPKTYIHDSQNLRVHIAGIKEGSPQNTTAAMQSEMPHAIWLSSEVITQLGFLPHEEVLLYTSTPTDTSATVNILEHPGFCYLKKDTLAAFSLQVGDIIEVTASLQDNQHCVYAQVHASFDETSCYLDSTLTKLLPMANASQFALKKVRATLHWIMRMPLDEAQNKARNAVGFPHGLMEQSGYLPMDRVPLFQGDKQIVVAVEPFNKSLAEGMLVVTPFTLRQTKLCSGQGIFLGLDHIPSLYARVGVFNVDEVGVVNAKGSEQLASVFPMPCRVELFHPTIGTSLDILLERDPYPRKGAMVRLSYTAREMLHINRGEQLIVRALPHSATNRSVWDTLKQVIHIVTYYFLMILINRRSILVSVAPAHTWDDQAKVTRLDPEALTILGIDSGDKITIKYRERSISRVVLTKDAEYKNPIPPPGTENAAYNQVPTEFQIGLDALARYKIGAGQMDFGCVVEIERDMFFILRKSLNLALLPIIGTVLTVLTFLAGRSLVLQITVALVIACIFFYLALSVERTKVS